MFSGCWPAARGGRGSSDRQCFLGTGVWDRGMPSHSCLLHTCYSMAQVRQYYRGEQLAYITAFATGAKLIFGDRPKDITYRRLAAVATSSQLDEAFGLHCVSHYRDLLGLAPAVSPDVLPASEVIMMQVTATASASPPACIKASGVSQLDVSSSQGAGGGHVQGGGCSMSRGAAPRRGQHPTELCCTGHWTGPRPR